MDKPLSVLIAYSTTDGHTLTICRRIQAHLQRIWQSVPANDQPPYWRVHIMPLAQVQAADLSACDVVVLGASIRYGRHKSEVQHFANQYAQLLNSKVSVFFSVSSMARKPNRCTVGENPYVQKWLRAVAWKPTHVALLAGRIDYPRYSFWERHLIRLIMHLTGGPTDIKQVFELTDWDKVAALAQKIAELTHQAAEQVIEKAGSSA